MRIRILFSLLLVAATASVQASAAGEVVRPYRSDLCTGYPEGTRRNPRLWEHCCRTHDLYLWAGGDRAQRIRVDEELRECVRATGEDRHATLIWLGVRVGSLSPAKIPGKQWGNAWGNRVRRARLTEGEISALVRSLETDSELDSSAIDLFARELETRNSLE